MIIDFGARRASDSDAGVSLRLSGLGLRSGFDPPDLDRPGRLSLRMMLGLRSGFDPSGFDYSGLADSL